MTHPAVLLCASLLAGIAGAGGTGAAAASCADSTAVLEAPPVPRGPAGSLGVLVTDLNEDGLADLVTTGHPSDLLVHLGTRPGGIPDARFLAPLGLPISSPYGVVAVDFNGDGILDLAATGGAQVGVWIGRGAQGVGDGTFHEKRTYGTGPGARDLVVLDADDDGILDLVAASGDASGGSLWYLRGRRVGGTGDGSFLPAYRFRIDSGSGALAGLVAADFDGDSSEDLAIARTERDIVTVLPGTRGAPDRAFGDPRHFAVGRAPTHLAAADLDGDGALDLACSLAGESAVAVLHGDGRGSFSPPVRHAVGLRPQQFVVADLDGDGRLDLAVADSGSSTVSLLLGSAGSASPHGTFLPARTRPSISSPFGAAAADFDEDGDLDLAVVGRRGELAIHPGACRPWVQPPAVTRFAPLAGSAGDSVVIEGRFGGALEVRFHGVRAALAERHRERLVAVVPAGATTGTIVVANELGSAESASAFWVGNRPAVHAAVPDSGRPGAAVVLAGTGFTGADRVAFGPRSDADFQVLADDRIAAVVDRLAVSGRVQVHTPLGTAISPFEFRVLEPPSPPGAWTRIPVPFRSCWGCELSAVLDTSARRLLALNAWEGIVWELPLEGSGRWRRIDAWGVPPTRLRVASMVYDPVRDQLLVRGARGPDSLWVLAFHPYPTWSRIRPAGSGPTSWSVDDRGQQFLHDPLRDEFLVWDGGASLWTLHWSPEPRWTRHAPAGPRPTFVHRAAAYDPARRTFWFYGGDFHGPDTRLWSLILEPQLQWHFQRPQPAPERAFTSMVHDPLHDRLVLFGGRDLSGASSAEVWTLDLSDPRAWSRLEISPSGPSARYGHHAFLDPVRLDMIVFASGDIRYGASDDLDAWRLALDGEPRWEFVAGSPAPRRGATLTHDERRHRLILFGGAAGDDKRNDAWVFQLGADPRWSPLQVEGPLPPPQSSHAAIYDPVRDRVITLRRAEVYDPWGYLSYVNDMWALSLAGEPRWSRFLPTGRYRPYPVYDMAAVYDFTRDRMIIDAGAAEAPGTCTGRGCSWGSSYPDGTVALDLSTEDWSAGYGGHLAAGHVTLYDQAGDQLVTFGGLVERAVCYGPGDPECGTIWWFLRGTMVVPLSGGNWRTLPRSPSPPPRTQHAGVLDTRRRMWIYGGRDSLGVRSDLWMLDLAGEGGWSLVHDDGPPIAEAIAAYDPVDDAMWVYDPADGSMWRLQLGDVPTPALAAPMARVHADRVEVVWSLGRVFDPALTVRRRTGHSPWVVLAQVAPDGLGRVVYVDRAVVASARYAYRLSSAAGDLGPEVWVEVPAAPRLALRGAATNPSPARLEVLFTLPDGAPARLELLDVAGRRMATRAVGGLGAGDHRLDLGASLHPGLYWIVLRRAGERRVARVVVVSS